MIHQYKLNDKNIVIDCGSGSIHQVDDLVYDIIAIYQPDSEKIKSKITQMGLSYSEKDINEAMNDIEELKSQGLLFAEDILCGGCVDLTNMKKDVKSLCLHVAHTCNLNCEYCFAAGGKYHGADALMSFETAKAAIDFLIKSSGTKKLLDVDFFGGEPLMNLGVVKETIKYARSIEKEHNKEFRFTITTNGLLIDDDFIDFCNKEIYTLVLSLDGRKDIHDKFRKTVGGSGSFDIIVPKFQKLVEKRGGKGYYIRGTFTHNNTDFAKDILHMFDLGFSEISMEPVVSPEGTAYALTDDDLIRVKEQYEILANKILELRAQGKTLNFYHLNLNLKDGPCLYKRLSGCGAGSEYVAVTPKGDIYPCHQFVSDSEYCLGNVFDGIKNSEKQQQFKGCNVSEREECKSCWAKLYCGGGCFANSYHAQGDVGAIHKQSCEIFKKRLECAIAMQCE